MVHFVFSIPSGSPWFGVTADGTYECGSVCSDYDSRDACIIYPSCSEDFQSSACRVCRACELCRQSWKWVDGTELTYTNWDPGEPDNNKCGRLNTDEYTGWSDYDCDALRTYICERGT